MPGSFHKDPTMKYTDMCIYIDANLDKIIQTNEYPDVESKVYEYLYHILYALACKQNFFPNFEDYDAFAMYGASELYISMRNKQANAGKVVRGREVVPIKSSLNFIKSVLFPLKVNYTRQNFATVFNPEIDQDTSIISDDLKTNIKSQYQRDLQTDLEEVLLELPNFISKVLLQTPYKKDAVMLKRLYVSCQLTLLNDITIPNKLKNKLNKYTKMVDDYKILNSYRYNESEVILWHLPEHIKDYVRILVTKIKHLITDAINQSRSYSDLSDEMVDNIMKSAYAQYDEGDGY